MNELIQRLSQLEDEYSHPDPQHFEAVQEGLELARCAVKAFFKLDCKVRTTQFHKTFVEHDRLSVSGKPHSYAKILTLHNGYLKIVPSDIKDLAVMLLAYDHELKRDKSE